MNKGLFAKVFKFNADTGVGSSGGASLESAGETQPIENSGGNVDEQQHSPSQSELDSYANKAVHKALENYKKGEAQRIADAIKKEQDYSKLSEAERSRKEFEDQQLAFAQEKAEFEHDKLVVAIEKDLVSKGLPVELAETFAKHGDGENALKAVGVFEEVFNRAVSDKVNKALRQETPGAGGGISSATNYGQLLAKKFHTAGKID